MVGRSVLVENNTLQVGATGEANIAVELPQSVASLDITIRDGAGQVVRQLNFGNPQGLQPISNNNWAQTFSSGTPLVGASGSASLGLIQSGALEDSNVDLSEQLVNLIIAQRNFQANTEVISTADRVTQSVINIR